MCLSSVDLNLRWSEEEQAFVGIGYKRIDFGLKFKYKVGEWQKCLTDSFGEKIENSLESSRTNVIYHPAFHIFINQSDAKKYHYSDGDVYKVMFAEVLSFGKNELDYELPKKPCVVTRWMKILEKVE